MPVELETPVERCKAADVCTITAKDHACLTSVEEAKALNAALERYFEPFAAPSEKCLKCGTTQGGIAGAILGGFTWGLAHGEGRCQTCGWPGRALHYPKDDEGEDILDRPIPMILQYHPDFVEAPSTAPSGGE